MEKRLPQKVLIGTATLSHWIESEGATLSDQCEHNVESCALRVVEQDQSGEKIALFLEHWELARVALSCHFAPDMLCQEMLEVWWLGCCCQLGLLSQQEKPFRHRGRAVTVKEWRCGERKTKQGRNVADPRELSWPATMSSFLRFWSQCEHLVPVGRSFSRRFKRG